MGDQLAMSQANRPTTFYHGTSIESAMRIQVYGFDISLSGSSSGELLGKGVYCTPVLLKAVDYAKGKPSHGVVLELLCDLGNCKKLTPNDPMRKTWQLYKFDSAWMPNGANDRNMAENCIKDPARITLVRIIAGDTCQLKRMGMFIRPLDGRLSMIGDQVSSSQSRAAKRKRESAPLADGDLSFHALLCLWKLEDVSDLLLNEGVTDTKVLTEEMKEEDIAKMAIGQIYKNRLSKLLQHVVTQSILHTTQISSGLEILGRMRKEPDNAAIQLNASSALVDLLRGNESIIAELTTQGLLPLLVTAISSHPTEIQLHQNTFVLIDLVVLTKINFALEVDNLNLISAIFGSMEINYKDEGLQLQCIATLRTLVKEIRNDHNIKKIVVSQDAIAVLLATMDAHVKHLLLQSAICRLLFELAKLPQFIVAVVFAGGMRSVMAAMNAHPNEKKMHDLGWHVLTSIMHNSVVRTTKVMSEGGVRLLLSLLGQRPTDTVLQQKGVRLLVLFSRNNNELFCSEAMAVGGIDIVLTVMHKQETDEEIVGHCINTLSAFSVLGENKAAIGNPRVIEFLRSAIEAPPYKQNPKFLGGIAQLLCNLASHEQTRCAIEKAGFIPSLVATMSAHKDSLYAQEQCVACLHNMCSNTPEQYIIFTKEGGVGVVLESMIAFPDCVRIQEASYLLLRFISWETIGPDFAHKNGVSVVFSGIKTHMHRVSNLIHGLSLLGNIATADSFHHAEIFAADGIALVIDCMKTHPDSHLVQLKGLRILWLLSYSTVAVAQAIPVILVAIRLHRDTKDVVCNCLSVLVLISKSPDPGVKKLLRDNGTLKVITDNFPKKVLDEKHGRILTSFMETLGPEQLPIPVQIPAPEYVGVLIQSGAVDPAEL